ncbi:MAG: methionyl-tRNA formyltransferase, partial [Alphaproteobacteria bacterium]
MRLAFFGTPDFAVPALQALLDAGHEIACVYTQPPRPAGRGQNPRPSPVQDLANRHGLAEHGGLAVATPTSLKDPATQQDFAALRLDAAVVVAYGLILPPAILSAPRYGCLNIHASLLPRWRGAAPIQRAIMAGDSQSGVTIMAMDEGLDTGPMLLAESVPITDETTGESLHDTLAALGARMIVRALAAIAEDGLQTRPQPAQGVTYAAKLSRGEAEIDWCQPAQAMARKIRAFTPWPGTWFSHQGHRFKILAATPLDSADGEEPGTVLEGTIIVACGEGALRLD